MITEIMREPLAKTIKYIKPVGYDSAQGLTAEVFDQLQADFMPAPLIALHSPVPELMAGAWSVLRETLMAGQVDRTHKEVVAAAVSKANECPFCVDAHTVLLRATSNEEVANAILRGEHERIHDVRMRALVHWVWANRSSHPETAVPPPFSRDEAPEMIGTAITFHYLNRMANIFLGDTILPFSMPSALKELTYRVYAATEGRRAVRRLPSGTSLKFLPAAPLPEDMQWAAGNSSITGAYAGFARVVEQAGEQVLPVSVRRRVESRLQAWNGEAMGLSRHWVEREVAEIEAEHQAAARLALLTAFASYQVDAGMIEAFRSHYDSSRADAALLAATAWASFAAARRVGAWLAQPFRQNV